MRGFIKKAKVSHTLILLCVIAVFSEFIIGAAGILGLNKLDSGYETIIEYNDWGQEVKVYSQKYADIYNNIFDILYSGNFKNVELVKEGFVSVDNFIEESIADDECDEKELELLEALKTSFDEFHDMVSVRLDQLTELKNKLENMKEMDPSNGENPGEHAPMSDMNGMGIKQILDQMIEEIDFDKFSEASARVTEDFEELSNYISQYTEEEKDIVHKLYKSITTMIISVIVISMIICAIILTIIIKGIKEKGNEVINIVREIAEGRLNVEFTCDGKDEFEILKRELKRAISSFKMMITNVKTLGDEVNGKSIELSGISSNLAENSRNISSALDEVASGTVEQANDLVNINNSLQGFSKVIEVLLKNIDYINVTTNEIAGDANKSNEKMDKLIETLKNMHEVFTSLVSKINILGGNITRINDITNLIDSIAEETNLLALNAAIEAARAGEGGKGFAVVAEEVRKLAEQSKESAKEITEVIKEISADTQVIISASGEVGNNLENSLAVIEDSINSFGGIVTSIEGIVPKIEELAESSVNIEKENAAIVNMVENASAIAEEVSASSEEISASIKEMNNLSENVGDSSVILKEHINNLQGSIGEFEL